MRFILLNALRDRQLEARRRANPGKVQRRPVIGGRPLPSGARRILGKDHLTASTLDEIEEHVRYGNVRFIAVGVRGEVDFTALRKRLGLRIPVVEPEEAPSVGETLRRQAELAKMLDEVVYVDEPDEVPVLVPDAEPAPAEDLVEAVLEGEPELVETGPPDEYEVDVPDDLDTFLLTLKNKQLGPVLVMLGHSGSGKRKAALVGEILAALGDPELDPVQGRNALAKIASHRPEA